MFLITKRDVVSFLGLRLSAFVPMYTVLSTASFISAWVHDTEESSTRYQPSTYHPKENQTYLSPVIPCLKAFKEGIEQGAVNPQTKMPSM